MYFARCSKGFFSVFGWCVGWCWVTGLCCAVFHSADKQNTAVSVNHSRRTATVTLIHTNNNMNQIEIKLYAASCCVRCIVHHYCSHFFAMNFYRYTNLFFFDGILLRL